MLSIEQIKNPQELINFIDNNIEWGFIHNGNRILNLGNNWRRIYRTLSINQILENKIGTCVERVKIAGYALEQLGYKPFSFCIRDSNITINNSGHCFIAYYDNNFWYWFESSWIAKKQIHIFDTLEELLSEVIFEYFKKQEAILQNNVLKNYKWLISEYISIPDNLNYRGFSEEMDKTQLSKTIYTINNEKHALIKRANSSDLLKIKYYQTD